MKFNIFSLCNPVTEQRRPPTADCQPSTYHKLSLNAVVGCCQSPKFIGWISNALVDSMTYYTLSRFSRNLAVAIGKRRQRISKTHNLSPPRQHYNNLTSYTRYNSNRIPFNQSLHCFSSLSTIEDDKDSSGVGSDDDLDGLKSEIERLKNLDGGYDNVSSLQKMLISIQQKKMMMILN
jgi:hypothetical protein